MSGADTPLRIVTTGYKIAGNRLVGVVMRREASRRWWLWVLPVLTLCVLGVLCDAAYALVALMLVMLVYPTLTMVVYFNGVLRTEALLTMTPQHAVITPSGVHVEYDAEAGRRHMAPRDIEFALCHSLWFTRDSLVVEVCPNDYVIIPSSAMTGGEWMALYMHLGSGQAG